MYEVHPDDAGEWILYFLDGGFQTVAQFADREDAEFAKLAFERRDLATARSSVWDRSIGELLRIRNLKDDWDGQGTEAPHPALVDGAIALAQYLKANGLPPADRVLASENGTVYFEWHSPGGYWEIEVTSPLNAQARCVSRGSNVPTLPTPAPS